MSAASSHALPVRGVAFLPFRSRCARHTELLESCLRSTLADADSNARAKARVLFWAYSAQSHDRASR